MSGTTLQNVDHFKYLGSYMESTEADIDARKAVACGALNNMTTIWKSLISCSAKLRIFHTTVESMLLYGCEA